MDKIPSDLGAEIRNNILVSTAIAEKNKAVPPPVSEMNTFYPILIAAKKITIVG